MTDRNTLLASLRLSDRRLTHTLGVEKAALTSAARHFPALREEEVSAAALLHDLSLIHISWWRSSKGALPVCYGHCLKIRPISC